MHGKKLLPLLLLLPLLDGCRQGMVASSSQEAPALSAGAPLYMRMTDRDVELADQAVQQALENHFSMTTLPWKNTASGNSGDVTPLRTYKSLQGYYCRTYRENIKVGRRNETYTDTACRGDDGQWYPI